MTKPASDDKPIFFPKELEFQEWARVLEWLGQVEELKSRFKWRS